MKKPALKIALFLTFCLSTIYTVIGQVPQGFNYQAVARRSDGTEIQNTTLQVKVSILSDTSGFYASGSGTYLWEEQQNVTTNNLGFFTLTVGNPAATKIQGSAATFSAINWTKTPLYIGTKIYYNSSWKYLGAAKLNSVPYSMVSQSVSGLKSLSVKGETTVMDSALFEVKNNLGKTVFAVYNEGVRVSVGDGVAKGSTKGGFAIGGFDAGKTGIQDYLRIYPDSTRIFVKNPTKGTKGGFAIGGFDGAKGSTGNYLDVTPENYFIGHESGSKITTGMHNSVLGYRAGKNISSGSNNIMFGETTGYSLTTGNHNTLIGSGAGYSHTNQEYNVMIGTAAGFNVNSSGWNGSFNTFIGINSGYKIRNSKENLFLGTNSGYMLEGGWSNTIVGIDAGRGGFDDPTNYHGYVTERNTILGCQAGYMLLNGNNNVFIGYQAGAAETGTSNKLYIANGSGSALIYGDFSSGRIGLGTLSPGYKLDVVGDINVSSGNFKINGTNLSASALGAEPALTKGNLTATGPISLNATQQLIGGPAVISITDATTSAKGAVQLSNSYAGVSQSLATTEKALTDGLATKATGSGLTMGKIYLTNSGEIISTAAGSFTLTFDRINEWFLITNNNSSIECSYWYTSQIGATSGGNTGNLNPTESYKINGLNTDFSGYEIHFGQANGATGWCSVWLQFYHGRLVGHYIIY